MGWVCGWFVAGASVVQFVEASSVAAAGVSRAAGADDGTVVDVVVITGAACDALQVTFVWDAALESTLITQERTTFTRTSRFDVRCGPAIALGAANNRTAIAGMKIRMSGVVYPGSAIIDNVLGWDPWPTSILHAFSLRSPFCSFP